MRGRHVRLLSLIIFEINIEIQLAVLNGRVCHHAKRGVFNAFSVCAGGIETCITVSCHVNVPYCYWFERTRRYVILMLQSVSAYSQERYRLKMSAEANCCWKLNCC